MQSAHDANAMLAVGTRVVARTPVVENGTLQHPAGAVGIVVLTPVGVPEQLEAPERQECYWELAKFLTLALKANPNVLECLYTPLVEHADPIARELLGLRGAFLSKLVYQTYNGYALSQFRKLEA